MVAQAMTLGLWGEQCPRLSQVRWWPRGRWPRPAMDGKWPGRFCRCLPRSERQAGMTSFRTAVGEGHVTVTGVCDLGEGEMEWIELKLELSCVSAPESTRVRYARRTHGRPAILLAVSKPLILLSSPQNRSNLTHYLQRGAITGHRPLSMFHSDILFANNYHTLSPMSFRKHKRQSSVSDSPPSTPSSQVSSGK